MAYSHFHSIKEEALKAMQDAAEAYVADMLAAGVQLPAEGMLTVDAPRVTVTHDT